METRTCTRCGETKPLTEYYLTHGNPSGRCKPCYRAIQQEGWMKPPRNPTPPGTKRCGFCKQIKPITEFYTDKNFYDGRNPGCKECRKAKRREWAKRNPEKIAAMQRRNYRRHPERYADYWRKKKYGMAPGDYDRLLEAQGGRCAICGTDDPSPRRAFHVDHCHNTGVIRGLLCGPCNAGIGSLKHSEEVLLSAIRYLKS